VRNSEVEVSLVSIRQRPEMLFGEYRLLTAVVRNMHLASCLLFVTNRPMEEGKLSLV
jgi:hypothetical protein